MPELPEVETVVRNLRAPLLGHVVKSMWFDWERLIDRPAPQQFADRIVGQRFKAIYRRAKYIICELDHDYLVVHLKMTGRLYVVDEDAQLDADRWLHFRLSLDQGKQLRFSDSRKFGRIYLVSDLTELTAQLGPEPLENTFTVDELGRRLHGRKRAIKPMLLDQTVIAGVGNIYADEALHRARIHPVTPANCLTANDVANLHEAIRHVLQKGIQHEGASINWYRKPDGTMGESQDHFLVYDREGEPCAVCGTPIQKTRVAQRGTYFCPVCQPLNGAGATS